MLYLIIFFSSLIITIFTTPYLIEYLKKVNIVDEPHQGRRIHKIATPRMGGIIIYIIVIVSLFSYSNNVNQVRFIIVGSIFVAIAGIIDDIKGLSWRVKFGLQILAVIHILYLISDKFDQMSFFGVLIPFPINYVILFVFVLGAINSINLMDGMDGLVSGFSLLVFGVLIILSYATGNQLLLVISVSIVGALLGFLKFNAAPAKIFLGDTGSLTIGYFLVLSTLLFSVDITPGTLRLSFPVLLLAVPLIDTLKVMALRLKDKKNPFLPDKNHLHHVILGQNIKAKSTVFIILTFTVGFLTIALVYLRYSRMFGYISFFVLGVLLLLMKRIVSMTSLFSYLETIYHSLFNFSVRATTILRNLFLLFSSLCTIFVIFYLLPSHSSIDKKIIITSMFFVLMLFVTSTINYRKTNQYNDIYVFINLIVFLMIGYFSNSFLRLKYLHSELFDIIFIVSIVSLVGLIILFILSRKYYLPASQTLFSGLDMILIALILLVFMFNQIMGVGNYAFIGLHSFYALIIYIWYKIISNLNLKYNRYLFFSSFLLPIFSLVLIYFNF
ncbi:MAG: hypothetical protein M0P61_04175 [Ignavibacteriaceae bacterium]|nr:hypothetical protein [Ignavibacteriaceae bacterium]